MSDEKMKLKGKLGVEGQGHEGERVPVCDEAGNVIGHAVIGPSGSLTAEIDPGSDLARKLAAKKPRGVSVEGCRTSAARFAEAVTGKRLPSFIEAAMSKMDKAGTMPVLGLPFGKLPNLWEQALAIFNQRMDREMAKLNEAVASGTLPKIDILGVQPLGVVASSSAAGSECYYCGSTIAPEDMAEPCSVGTWRHRACGEQPPFDERTELNYWGKETACAHGLTFDPVEADKLSAAQVRTRWPRLEGRCPLGCGYTGIAYASALHFTSGDW